MLVWAFIVRDFIMRKPAASMKGKKMAKYKLICQHFTNENTNPKALVTKDVTAIDIFSPMAASMARVFCDIYEVILLVYLLSYQAIS